jgi:hypothetical protein
LYFLVSGERVDMSLLGWIGVAVVAWVVCGAAIGLLVGRVIGARERQVQWDCPRDDARPVRVPSRDDPIGRRG